MFGCISAVVLRGGVPTHSASPLVGEGLSFQAISWAIEHSRHNAGTLLVLLVVAHHINHGTDCAWPSIATIAKESRLSERQVQYSLKVLEESGELTVARGTGRKHTNLYSMPQIRVQSTSPFIGKGANGDTKGCRLEQERVKPTAPEQYLTGIKDNSTLRWEIINQAIQETEANHSRDKKSASELIAERFAQAGIQ